MNQNYQPMPPVMGAQRPRAIRPWLLIIFVIVLLAGAGFVWYFYFGPGKAAKTTTTPATTDPTADWKTYTNTKYGYSIKYPKNFVELSAEDGSVIGTPDPTAPLIIFGVDKTSVSSKKDIQIEVLDSQAGIDAAKTTLAKKGTAEDTTIGTEKLPAKTVEATDGTYYWIEKNNKLYKFFQDTNATDLATMLKTLKFTTPTSATSTSTDLTYTNKDYGFTMTFPAAWKGYKFKEANISGATMTYYIEVPTTDASAGEASSTNDAGYYSPFAISVYTLAQWDAIDTEGPHDTLITKNDTYAFGWSQANGVPPSDFTKAMQDQIKTIIDSFTL